MGATESWIQRGGAAFLPGLGESTSIPVATKLQEMILRLSRMVWGVSDKFQAVLEALLDEEGETPGSHMTVFPEVV